MSQAVQVEKSPGSTKWDGRSYGGRVGHGIFLALLRLVGRWPSYLVLALIVPYYCLIARKAVRASRAYLDRRLGPTGFVRRLARTYRHFFEFGQVLLDRFVFHLRGPDSFDFDHVGFEHIEAAIAEGKGVVFLSAHLGAWEIAASARRRFVTRGLPVPINVVMHLPPDGRVPSFVERLERDGDLKVIPIHDAENLPFAVVSALERGEIVAFHGDRTVSPSARTKAPFLGADAWFPTGPWLVASATGAPVVQTFLVKRGWRRYSFVVEPPVHVKLDRRQRERQLLEQVASYARVLERITREHPYQWFNFYDFWSAA